MSTLPENLSFDCGSTSSDMQSSTEARLPEFRITTSETNIQYFHHLGESSSRAPLDLEECPLESSNILSLDNADGNEQGDRMSNQSSSMPISGSDSVPQDLNMCPEFVAQEGNRALGSSSEKRPATGSSSDDMSSGFGRYMMEDSDYRPGYSLDARRLSCKRKALEVQIGHSSGAGSSSCFEHADRNSAPDVSMPSPASNNLAFCNGPEQAHSRTQLGVRGAERRRNNFRLRISGNPLSTEANVGNSDVSSSRYASRLARRNSLFDLNPTPPMESGSRHGQPVLPHIPSARRNPHSRWGGASSSRTSEREDEESGSGNIPRSVFEHPMFLPASEMGSSSQQPTNWNLAGWNNSSAGDVASTSQAGSASRVNLPSPSPHRGHPLYPRRLSEMVRRSLLSAAGTESGGQSSSSAIRSQETSVLSGSGNQGPQSSNTRSALLERHLDGAFGVPYSLRSLASAGEGRSNVMSEQIRHVLDLMRRGEGLRFEDMMMLDHSVFFGMADVHDRHRNMRLDIDNMSYEELLALEDRIGNVCTGLNEETITTRLKQHKHVEGRGDEGETEPCSICREEYNEGEDVGRLECGHDFHRLHKTMALAQELMPRLQDYRIIDIKPDRTRPWPGPSRRISPFYWVCWPASFFLPSLEENLMEFDSSHCFSLPYSTEIQGEKSRKKNRIHLLLLNLL